MLCGVAEPVGGLLAWVVLTNLMTPSAFAILFGLVGGIMIHICVKKLIPTALRYDPHVRTQCNQSMRTHSLERRGKEAHTRHRVYVY